MNSTFLLFSSEITRLCLSAAVWAAVCSALACRTAAWTCGVLQYDETLDMDRYVFILRM